MNKKIEKILIDIGRTFPLIIIIGHIFAFIITHNYKQHLFFLGGYYISEGLNHLLKFIIKQQRPDKRGYIDAGMGTGCGLFPKNNSPSKTFGMPSGHAQSITFAATVYSIYIYNNSTHKTMANVSDFMSISALWLTVLFVCWTRVKIKCHSILQVLFCSFIGMVLGIILYIIFNRIDSNTWKYDDKKYN